MYVLYDCCIVQCNTVGFKSMFSLTVHSVKTSQIKSCQKSLRMPTLLSSTTGENTTAWDLVVDYKSATMIYIVLNN